MTRKCFDCGTTKGLKGLTIMDCDCGKCDGFSHNKSVCEKCYFSEMVACEMEGHSTIDCLEYPACENHEQTKALYKNWNDFDYNYKVKGDTS